MENLLEKPNVGDQHALPLEEHRGEQVWRQSPTTTRGFLSASLLPLPRFPPFTALHGPSVPVTHFPSTIEAELSRLRADNKRLREALLSISSHLNIVEDALDSADHAQSMLADRIVDLECENAHWKEVASQLQEHAFRDSVEPGAPQQSAVTGISTSYSELALDPTTDQNVRCRESQDLVREDLQLSPNTKQRGHSQYIHDNQQQLVLNIQQQPNAHEQGPGFRQQQQRQTDAKHQLERTTQHDSTVQYDIGCMESEDAQQYNPETDYKLSPQVAENKLQHVETMSKIPETYGDPQQPSRNMPGFLQSQHVLRQQETEEENAHSYEFHSSSAAAQFSSNKYSDDQLEANTEGNQFGREGVGSNVPNSMEEVATVQETQRQNRDVTAASAQEQSHTIRKVVSMQLNLSLDHLDIATKGSSILSGSPYPAIATGGSLGGIFHKFSSSDYYVLGNGSPHSQPINSELYLDSGSCGADSPKYSDSQTCQAEYNDHVFQNEVLLGSALEHNVSADENRQYEDLELFPQIRLD